MRGAILAATLLALTITIAGIQGRVAVAHRHQVWADLAAIAAATSGNCADAYRVVEANGGKLPVTCELRGDDAYVTVGANARARAGP